MFLSDKSNFMLEHPGRNQDRCQSASGHLFGLLKNKSRTVKNKFFDANILFI
jgi:hypothetical protein